VHTLGDWSLWRLSFGLYELIKNIGLESLVLRLIVVEIGVLSIPKEWMLEGI